MKYSEVRALSRREFGIWGEELAAKLLMRDGYEILARNWRYSNVGEIDIIAKRGDLIAFIEVKARRSLYAGTPIEAVNDKKYWQIRKIAGAYLSELGVYTENIRIDIFGILALNGKVTVKRVLGARKWWH